MLYYEFYYINFLHCVGNTEGCVAMIHYLNPINAYLCRQLLPDSLE